MEAQRGYSRIGNWNSCNALSTVSILPREPQKAHLHLPSLISTQVTLCLIVNTSIQLLNGGDSHDVN